MSVQSQKSSPMTCADTTKCIVSLGSADGVSPCDWQDGLTTDMSGPGRRLVNLSLQRESAKEKMTSDTCGLSSSDLSKGAGQKSSSWSKSQTPSTSSSARAASLEMQDFMTQRLMAKSSTVGSTLYKLNWKAKVTPAHRSVYQLVASVRRTSDKDSGLPRKGWTTPRSGETSDNTKAGTFSSVSTEAKLTGWPTPRSMEIVTGKNAQGGLGLTSAANLAGWQTPQAGDGKPRNLRYKGQMPSEKGNTRNPEMSGSYRGELKDWAGLAGWPTPVANDDNKTPEAHLAMKKRMGERDGTNANRTTITSLQVMAKMTGWPSPTAQDSARGGKPPRPHDTGIPLNQMAAIAGPARLTASGQILTGSSAEMESGGRLNPELSRWLMSYPPEWDACAPPKRPRAKASSKATVTPSSRKSRKTSSKPSSTTKPTSELSLEELIS